MAETVQYHLERMVGELEDLEQKEIFTKSEIRNIVKKRTKFEYGLKRRRASRADFLRYIEYEINVDALRRKRKARLGIKGKTTISDYSIEKRIHSIFERALLKHPEDLTLWMQYIEYVKAGVNPDAESTGNIRLLSRIYARAIQAHPFEPRLWIMAAAFEFEVNVNGSAARILLQRSLRVNPKSKDLWLEYFRLELLLVEKIKARRRVLGIDGSGESENTQGAEEEEDENTIKLPELGEENSEASIRERFEESALSKLNKSSAELSENDRTAMAKETNPFLQGVVAKLVFEQAISVIPDDIDFREQFVHIYSQFPDMQDAEQQVLDSISKDFASNPEARSYLATCHLRTVDIESSAFVDALQDAVTKFRAATHDLDIPEMWQRYIEFLTQWINAATDENLSAYLQALSKRAFESVISEKDRRLNSTIALEYVKQLNGMPALNWLADATYRFPNSDDVWKARLSHLIDASDGSSASEVLRIERLFESEALVKAPQSHALWSLWFDWIGKRFKDNEVTSDYVQSKYLASFIRTAQLPSDCIDLKTYLQVRFYNWAATLPSSVILLPAADINTQIDTGIDSDDDDNVSKKAGIEESDNSQINIAAVRQAYQNVARHAFPTSGFYKKCLDAEYKTIDSSNETKPDLHHAINLHEFACRLNETDTKPWISYLEFLIKFKELNSASNIFWRASKIIPESEKDEFELAYHRLLQV